MRDTEYTTDPDTASATWMMSAVVVVTTVVVTVNEKVVPDGGTATLSGTTAEGSLLDNARRQPSVGAGAASVPLHCTDVPPATVPAEHARLAIVGSATTVNVSACVTPPKVPVIVTARVGGLSWVAIEKG